MLWQVPDAALIGGAFVLDSRAKGEVITIPNTINAVITLGYTNAGDGGGGEFERVAGPLTDGASFQSDDGAWWQLSSYEINPLQFGAVGDGLIDDTTAIQNTINYSAGRLCNLLDKQYLVTTVNINTSNFVLEGMPGITKLISNNRIIFNLGNINSVTFENIIFESTNTTTTESAIVALVIARNTTLSDLQFISCKFTAPNSNTNGCKFIADTGLELNEFVSFYQCDFTELGRMGVELSNTQNPADIIQRNNHFKFESCNFTDLGVVSPDYGMGISISGWANNVIVDKCYFDNVLYAAIEFVGATNSTIRDCVSATMTRLPTSGNASVIAMTTNPPLDKSVKMFENTISNFKCKSQHVGSLWLWFNTSLNVENCYFWTTAATTIIGTTFSNFSNTTFVNDAVTCVTCVEDATNGPAQNNIFSNCTFNQSGYAGLNAVVFRNNGANVQLNRVIGGTVFKAANHLYYMDNANSAFANIWERPIKTNSGETFVRSGINFTSDADLVFNTRADSPNVSSAQIWNVTSSVALTATRKITVQLNIGELKCIFNNTTGGQSIQIEQVGGGPTVTIPNGSYYILGFTGISGSGCYRAN